MLRLNDCLWTTCAVCFSCGRTCWAAELLHYWISKSSSPRCLLAVVLLYCSKLPKQPHSRNELVCQIWLNWGGKEVNHREGDRYLSATSKLFTEELWVKQTVVRCHWTQYHQKSAYSWHPRNYGEDNGIIQAQISNVIKIYMIPIVL